MTEKCTIKTLHFTISTFPPSWLLQVILNVDFTADQCFFFIEVCFIQNICHSEEKMSIVYNFLK